MQDSSQQNSPEFTPSRLWGLLSLGFPGLGQLLGGQVRRAAWVLGTGTIIGLTSWLLGRVGGAGSGYFFGLVILLPWWCTQAYAAYLPGIPSQWETIKIIGQKGHDIRFLGGLFLITAAMDLYIILANPEYGLTVFCSKPTGILGMVAKAQSPLLHVIIGVGFVRLQRWALWAYMVYAGFGLINATANFACLGYGRIRTVFLISLLLFTLYVFLRKNSFYRRA